MKIVDVYWIGGRVQTKVVVSPYLIPALTPPPAIHIVNALAAARNSTVYFGN